MKRFAAAFLGAFLAAFSLPLTVQAAEPIIAIPKDEIISSTAVLMDAETGQVLFDKNMYSRVFPASTTKIMTGVLVCQYSDPSDIVTVSESALAIDEWDSANIALVPGEQLPVDSAMYALMLPSANDAANALAEQVAGSQAAFAAMMNKKAREIGVLDTNFVNAHGLHDPNHYTTTYDMALITRYASKNATFMQYFGAATHTIPATNLQPIPRPFTNYQYMTVKESQFYNPTVLGGKVGYTAEAKHTMCTVAEQNGRKLICVVMGSPNRYDKFTDTDRLLRYGFEQFRPVTVPASAFAGGEVPMDSDGVSGTVTLHSAGDFTALLRNDLNATNIKVNVNLPKLLQKQDRLPTAADVTLLTDDDTLPTLLGTQPMIADIVFDTPLFPALAAYPGAKLQGDMVTDTAQPPTRTVQFWAIIALSCVLLVLVTLLIRRYYTMRKRRRERMERLNRRMRDYSRS